MPSKSTALLAVATALVAAAGCVDTRERPPEPGPYTVGGEDAWFTVGFAYDGRGVEGFVDGVVDLSVNHVRNEGELIARGMLDGHEWRLEMDRFYQQEANRTFQDGGIAADLHEHGATGFGDTSIPEVHVEMAGWGDLRLFVDDVPQPDPYTGNETWSGHFMVITTGVRDALSHGILRSGRNSAYDPANATDGYADSGDEEIHLVVKSRGAPTADDSVALSEAVTFTGADYSQDFPLSLAYPGTSGRLEFGLTAASLQLTRVDVAFIDEAGRPVAGIQPVTMGEMAGGSDTAEMDIYVAHPGTYAIRVTGHGTNARYTIAGQLDPPATLVLSFWWEEVLRVQRPGTAPTSMDSGP